MSYSYTPFVVPLILSAGISAALATHAWRLRRRRPGAITFVLLMLAVTVWSLGHALEMMGTDAATRYFWSRAQTLGLVFVAPLWLLFALQFIGEENRLARLLILSPPASLALGIITNDLHHLWWVRYWLDEKSPLPRLTAEYGPLFYVNSLVTYGCMIVGAAVYMGVLFNCPALYRRQAWLMILAAVLPVLGNAIYMWKLWPILQGLDLTIFAFPISGALLAYGAFRYQILDAVPIALRHAVEGMRDGIIVLDPQNRVIEINPAARRMLGIRGNGVLSRSFAEIASVCQVTSLENLIGKNAQQQEDIHQEISCPATGRIVSVTVSVIAGLSGESASRLIVLQDITRRKQSSEELRRRDAILEAVSFIAEQFLKTVNLPELAPEILRRLGEASGVSRVYLFENHTTSEGRLLTSQRFEWVAPGVKPQLDNPALQNFSFQETGFDRWAKVLGRNDVICGLVRDFPKRERLFLEAQEIRAVAVVPIFVKKEWWGFIGFDDCLAEREWSRSELESLRAAARILGAAIHHHRDETALTQAHGRLALLHAVAQRQVSHLASLRETALELAAGGLDAQTALVTIGRRVRSLLNCARGEVWLWRESKQLLELVFVDEAGASASEQKLPGESGVWLAPGQDLAGLALRLAQPQVVSDYATWTGRTASLSQVSFHAALAMPMIWQGERVGVLVALDTHPDRSFSADEVQLMILFASQAVAALTNAHLHEQVREQARRDSLTGVYNHSYLLKRLAEEVEKAARQKTKVTYVMIDVDYFKEYNDTYGHTTGDIVLRSIVQAIQTHIRPIDIVGRYGGEEFGIVFPGADASQVREVAERIRRTLAETRLPNGRGHTIPQPTISQGIATYPDMATSAEELVDLADRALYRAKARGRDGIWLAEAV